MIIAYASQRYLQLDAASWRYSRERGWSAVFQPVSRVCDERMSEEEKVRSADVNMGKKAGTWGFGGKSSNIQAEARAFTSLDQPDRIVTLPIVEGLPTSLPQMPLVGTKKQFITTRKRACLNQVPIEKAMNQSSGNLGFQ
jgi:hypothetical protein